MDPEATPLPSAPPEAPDAAARARSRRLSIAVALYVLVTAACFATAPPSVLAGHTPYNHFALLADGWLHGRLDLGGPPPAYAGNNDFAELDGKHYVSFPPFPAVLLLPAVWLGGGAEGVRDGAFFLLFTGLGPAALFLALEALSRSGRSLRSSSENAALGALFAFGTVYWFSAVQGTVWFAAHVVAVALAALYLLFSVDAERPLLAGIAFGLGFATRTPLVFAVPFFLHETWRAASRADPPMGARFAVSAGRANLVALARSLALFALPSCTVLGALFWHNAARFGSPLEFGHALLTVGWRARIDRWGLFSYHYLGRNLAVALTSLPFTQVAGAPFQINAHGLALWITSPFYAWAIWPKRTGSTYWALALTAACVALPSLCYQNSGWIQFGYRFSNDFAVFLFAMLAVGRRKLSRSFWVAAAFAIAVNAFGAVTFQRAAYGRFYFVDPTQKIVHQPD